ncbi:MAG: hypothetical protein ABJA66_17785, partial [Actinomycetota bacterium]
HGQSPTPQSTPQRTPDPSWERQRAIEQNNNRRLEAMRMKNAVNTRETTQNVVQNIESIYRKPTSKERKLLAPNPEDLKKFDEFLGKSDTGIIKLVPDFGCAANPNVIVASPDCLKYSMPGAGSSYSFRVNNYRIQRLADLTYTKNSFQAIGILLHGILVDIGDVSLEQVSLDTKGLKFLIDFIPTEDYKKGREIDREFLQGIKKEGFLYSRAVAAKENTTYILRSVAYRGKSYRAVQGLTYDEFDFDKRKDIIVAFRIIRTDEDGSITILWKELESKKSPTIKKTNQTKPDIEENKFVTEK